MSNYDTRVIKHAQERAAKKGVDVCDIEYCDNPDSCTKEHYHTFNCRCLDCFEDAIEDEGC